MKLSKFVMCASFAVVLAAPLSAFAQQAPPQQAPQNAQAPGQTAPHPGEPRINPTEEVMQSRWSHRLGDLNLTSQQQQQVQSIVHQYSQQHPAGTPFDPQSHWNLGQQIYKVLTPDQQKQYMQEAQQMRQQREQEDHQQAGGNPPAQNPPR